MIGSLRQVAVYVYSAPVDMRKQFDTLAALVKKQFGKSVLAGDLFLFVGKDRMRAKVLLWDGTGLCIYSKRLSKGHFTAPWKQSASSPLQMTLSELALFLEGSELALKVPLSPHPLVLASQRQVVATG